MKLLAALAALLLLGCNGKGDTDTIVPKSAKSAAAGDNADANQATPNLVRKDGVPHLGVIDKVELTTDGGAALTRDSFGSVRFWASLELQWSFSTTVAIAATQLVWSDDSKRISIAASNGGAVLNAKDGSMLRSRCAQAFETRGTPPNQFFSSSSGPSLCER